MGKGLSCSVLLAASWACMVVSLNGAYWKAYNNINIANPTKMDDLMLMGVPLFILGSLHTPCHANAHVSWASASQHVLWHTQWFEFITTPAPVQWHPSFALSPPSAPKILCWLLLPQVVPSQLLCKLINIGEIILGCFAMPCKGVSVGV